MKITNNEITVELPVSRQKAIELNQLKGADIYDLIAMAGKITRHFFPENKTELCSIINARSGNCSEDCAFCAQSSHYATSASNYPMPGPEDILRSAVKVEQSGVRRFSMVTSGRGIGDRDMEKVLEAIILLRRETNLTLCASLGIINEKQTSMLAEAGLSTYHHNLEAAPGYFDKICTTHTYQDRVQTILNAKAAGLEVCAGGILGLGETPLHQVELAFELQKLQIDSVPLNFLNPIPGTPLQGQRVISPLEILRAIAVFRLVLPRAVLRLCGGRKEGLRRIQPLAFLAGANGLMVGDYLTTSGEALHEDLQMLKDMEILPGWRC